MGAMPLRILSGTRFAKQAAHERRGDPPTRVLEQVCPEANVRFCELDAQYGGPIPEGLAYPSYVKPVKAAFSVLARPVRHERELHEHTRFGKRELWVIRRLVEPFAGSAAISIAASSQRLADSFWVNDAHAPLIALWKEIVARPEKLADDYAELWNDQLGRERIYFDEVRARFNQGSTPVDFLYLLARCVKAAIRYNSEGQFNNTSDNRRKGARPEEMRQRIIHASALFKGRTQLTSWDYKKVLADCTDQDFVYMDPPYQGVCGRRDQRYLPKFEHEEFCQELRKLNERGIQFIVSYDGRTGDKISVPNLSATVIFGKIRGRFRADTTRSATLASCARSSGGRPG